MVLQSSLLAISRQTQRWIAGLIALVPLTALAHPGHEAASFSAGFMHPFTGWDHVAAMVAMGFWAAQLGGRARIALPSVFVLAMLSGALLAGSWTPAPFIEAGIVVSVIAALALVIGSTRLSTALACLIVGCFAVFHGMAHTLDVAAPLGVAYLCGMLIASGSLLSIGVWMGMSLRPERILR